MFNSGFSETSASHHAASISRSFGLQDGSSEDDLFHILEDSDLEDEAAEAESLELDENDTDGMTDEFSTPIDKDNSTMSTPRRRNQSSMDAQTNSNDASLEDADTLIANPDTRTSRALQENTISSSLEKANLNRDLSPETVMVDSVTSAPQWPGPPKVRVVVRDVAYTTYRAVLYYVRMFQLFTHLR